MGLLRPNIDNLLQKKDIVGLIKSTNHSDSEICYNATTALSQMMDSLGISPFISALKDSNAYVRMKAIEFLIKLKDIRAVESLIASLKDTESKVREKAAEALTHIKDVRAVEPLIATLNDIDNDVRRTVVYALGEYKDARAVEPLILISKNQNGIVYQSIIHALIKIGDNRAIETLLIALDDLNLRKEVALALGKLGDERAINKLVSILIKRGEKENCVETLKMFEKTKVADELMKEFIKEWEHIEDTSYVGIPNSVPYWLGEFGDDRAVSLLLKYLNNHRLDRPEFFHNIISALGRLGDIRAVDTLVEIIKIGGDHHSISICAIALANLGGMKSADAIFHALNTPGDYFAWAHQDLVDALVKLKDTRVIDVLIQDLKSYYKNYKYREAGNAARDLGLFEDVRAVEPLIEALKLDPIRSEAAEALGKIRDARAVKPLQEALAICKDNYYHAKSVQKALSMLEEEIQRKKHPNRKKDGWI